MLVDPTFDLCKPLVLLSDIILFAEIDEVGHRFGSEERQPVDNVNLESRVSVYKTDRN